MFFRKRDKNEVFDEAMKMEAAEAMKTMVRELCFEVEAQRQVAIETKLFSDEEFTDMVEEFLSEAEEYFGDMNAKEILEDRIMNISSKSNTKVIEVRL